MNEIVFFLFANICVGQVKSWWIIEPIHWIFQVVDFKSFCQR